MNTPTDVVPVMARPGIIGYINENMGCIKAHSDYPWTTDDWTIVAIATMGTQFNKMLCAYAVDHDDNEYWLFTLPNNNTTHSVSEHYTGGEDEHTH